MSTQGRPEAPSASRWSRFWEPFWVLPAVIAGGSVVLGLVLSALDEALDNPLPWIFDGGPAAARAVLSSIAGAMISVTGLVFSITIVVLQLASSQFTPRILGTFLQLRITQVTLGVFTGSFLYALTVLRNVREGDVFVPGTTVTIASVYVVVAVAMFLAFINRITTMIQVSRTMSDVRARTVGTLDRLAPDKRALPGWSPRPGDPSADLVLDGRSGYVTVLAGTPMVRCAEDAGVVVELHVTPGDFLVAGQRIGRTWGSDHLDEATRRRLLDTLTLAGERSHHVDIGFGVRQLLDIAERALSPGVNDPTTALQAIHQLHVVLREMAVRDDVTPYLRAEDGEVRATYRPHRYARLLEQSVDEIVHYGSDSLRVLPALAVTLKDLESAARPEHQDVTRRARVAVEDLLRPTLLRSADPEARADD